MDEHGGNVDSRIRVAASNSTSHGLDGMFDSLPHELTNYWPDLVDALAVREALFELMQWWEEIDPGTWALLASQHFGRIVEPDHLRRSLDVLETTPWVRRRHGSMSSPAKSAAMSEQARWRLFDERLETAYREPRRSLS